MWCGIEVGGPTLTVEHIKPLCEGGTYDMGNLGIACPRCNIGRMNAAKPPNAERSNPAGRKET